MPSPPLSEWHPRRSRAARYLFDGAVSCCRRTRSELSLCSMSRRLRSFAKVSRPSISVLGLVELLLQVLAPSHAASPTAGERTSVSRGWQEAETRCGSEATDPGGSPGDWSLSEGSGPCSALHRLVP